MRTLILSDLHFGHEASSAGKMLDGIRALAHQYDRVILNGDTLDRLETDPGQNRLVSDLTDACAGSAGPPEFLAGNHDPLISSLHWVYLPKPAALIFHGDCIADCTHPAKVNDQLLAAALAELWQKLGGRPAKFTDLAGIYRQAQARFQQQHPPFAESRNGFEYLARMLYPPQKPLHVLRYWWTMPRRVARLAATFDKPVRHVIVGHSHLPGRWRVNDTTVFNTGSFMPLSAPYVVSVDSEKIGLHALTGLLRSKRIFFAPLSTSVVSERT